MTILIFFLGITTGVKFGAEHGIGHYLEMTLYTAILCLGWFIIYLVVAVKLFAKWPLGKVLTCYVVPTATFAAVTCSSLITLPVNLAKAKEVGVRNEVADFVIPCGSVINHNASALMYVATAPFVIHHIFGLPISGTTMVFAWPAIVLFSIAAPGLPAGMGTGLWGATLFASMLGLHDPLRSDFVATWIALSAGLPDMVRTAVSATSDGFTAIFFDSTFERFFAPGRAAVSPTATTERV
jgi:Na+/H+-dicarboxylate symporter